MRVTPVIHTHNPEQAVHQAEIAFDAGADGVFLINHGETGGNKIINLLDDYKAVAERFGDRYIGLNYLVDPISGYQLTRRAFELGVIDRLPDALWFDDLTGHTQGEQTEEYLGELDDLRGSDPGLSRIEMLGGVAFKYTPGYTSRAVSAADAAQHLGEHTDVVTTSGKGTGVAPSVHKVQAMKRAIGEKKLAVASGISTRNVALFRGIVDHVLIASSLETKPYSGKFIPERVSAFVTLAKQSADSTRQDSNSE